MDCLRAVFRGKGLFFLALYFILLLCISPSHAQTQTEKASSSGNNSGNSIGSGRATPDLFTGTMSYSIPIEVAPGRGGMQPNIALVYRSGSGNGWMGVGWMLEFGGGAIEQSTKFGVDYAANQYVFQMAGSTSDLVAATTPGEYRPKFEGAFNRVKKIPIGDEAYWEVTDKKGTRYLFGQTDLSRKIKVDTASCPPGMLCKPRLGPPPIFGWYLDRVEDLNGNFMTFSYIDDGGQLYPHQIQYNGNNFVKFYFEPRIEIIDTYPGNLPMRTAKQLKTIEVIGGGNLVRAYTFSYFPSPGTVQTMLSSVLQFGKDAQVNQQTGEITSGSSLPRVIFQYFPDTLGGLVSRKDGPTVHVRGNGFPEPIFPGEDTKIDLSRVKVGDFNGDGRHDLAILGEVGTEEPIKIYRAGSNDDFMPPINGPVHLVNGNNREAVSTRIGRIMTGDFNGDGKTDIARFPDDSHTGPVEIFFSNGNGFDEPPFLGPTFSTGSNQNALIDFARIRLGDFNGDGMTDIARIEALDASAPMSIYLAKKGPPFQFTLVSGPSFSDSGDTIQRELSRVVLGDFNGDRRTDIAKITSNGTPETVKIFLAKKGPDANTPLQFTPIDGPTVSVGSKPTIDLARIKMGDFNGDGKTDISVVEGWGTVAPMSIYLSAGDGFSGRFDGPSFFVDDEGDDALIGVHRIILGDFNGDGKTDIAQAPEKGSTGATNIYLSIGNGGAQSSHFTGPFVGPTVSIGGNTFDWGLIDLSRFRLGDFNGDGRIDIARVEGVNATVPMSLYYSSGDPSNFLQSVSNGLGAVTTISYRSSAQAELNPLLPFPVWHISSIVTNDGFGVVSSTGYTYRDGYYHIPERDFRGFNFVEVTGPVVDGKRSISKSWFHQGNDTAVGVNNPKVSNGYTKGKPYRAEVTDEVGNVFSKVETTYLSKSTSPYFFHPPGTVTTTICEKASCSSGKTTRVTFDYDANGNVTLEDNEGDVSDSTDNRTVQRLFSNNTGLWIVGLPLRETIYRGRSTAGQDRAAETTYFYDNAADCSVRSMNQNPTKGNLTRIERWLDGGINPETRMAYDSRGNVICTRDANGNITTISYDLSSTFPTTVTSPVVNGTQFQTTTKYYGVGTDPADNGLYGQVKIVTDPNGNTTTTTYDLFGRVKKTTAPDTGSTEIFYNDFGSTTQHIKTTTTTSASSSLSSWTYFDGLGRTILEKKTGPNGSVIVTKQEYNVTGTVKRSSLPYFEGGSPKWKSFVYDAIGRATLTTNPDGSTTSATYTPWVVTGIDASGHQKRETRDAYGRLKKVEEFTGVAPAVSLYSTTNYKYDVLGNLTSVDVEGVKTTMRYDTLSRKIAMADPDMGSCGDLTVLGPSPTFPWYPAPCWNYLYDANGNLIKQADAEGTVLEFTYDVLNRMTAKTFSDLAPPSAPASLTAMAVSANQINLSWSAATDRIGVKEYRVERCNNRLGTPACSNFVQITSVTTTSFSNTGLADGMDYTYRIRAMDTSGNLSGYSNIATATLPDVTPPSTPTGLTVTAFASNRIDLSWTASTDNVGVTEYQVQRCQGTGCTPALIATIAGTSYNDTQRTASTTYTYRVRARDAAGNWSSYSTSVSRSTPTVPVDTTLPTVPTAFLATTANPGQVNLTWTGSTDNLLLSYYEVERSANNGPYTVVSAPATTNFTDTSVSSGVIYFYRVRAVDGAGNKSGYSGRDLATTFPFTDDPLVAGVTPIKSVHITELRQAVNAVRAAAGLAAATWTDATLSGVPMKTVHIQELRTNLNAALSSLGLPLPSYTDPTLTSLVTVRKSAHVQDLRQGVK
jgi:YD repeat-containing protein